MIRPIIISLVIALLFSGCRSYVQVFEIKSTNTQFKEEFYVFENDTLKITYSFWAQKGLMTFAIYNKLDKPLYIDWKKSSYVDNSVKLNYWLDEEYSKSLEAYGSYYYDGTLFIPGHAISRSSVSSTIKPERITFIPPKSNYSKSQFYILPIDFFKLDTRADYKQVPRKDKPKKKTKIYERSYSSINSPLVFRNFLAFSFSEEFKTEFYVDNSFFISDIKEMDIRNFEYQKRDESKKGGIFYQKDENGNVLNFSDFKKESSFYLYIPKEGSVDYRK